MGVRPVHCAIDFGTSNSAVALPRADNGGVQLVRLEDGFTGMPTAVFYAVEGLARTSNRSGCTAARRSLPTSKAPKGA